MANGGQIDRKKGHRQTDNDRDRERLRQTEAERFKITNEAGTLICCKGITNYLSLKKRLITYKLCLNHGRFTLIKSDPTLLNIVGQTMLID